MSLKGPLALLFTLPVAACAAGGAGTPDGVGGASSGGQINTGTGGSGGSTSSAGAGGSQGGMSNAPNGGGGNTANTGGGGLGTGGNAAGNGGTSNAGANNSGGSGGTGTATFDRLARCTGGPYGDPLPATALTATAVPGSETDNGAGFQIFEGPVWLNGALYYSHILSNPTLFFPSTIRKLTPPSTIEDFIVESGSNGLAIDPTGNLVAATHDDQSLSRYDVTTLARSAIATTINGQPFNSPNDVVVRSDGTIYFSDPNWQNGGRTSIGPVAIYIVSPAGEVTPVATPFTQVSPGGPNGVALSLDEQLLYVTGNGAPGSQIKVFPVAPDGSLSVPTDFPPTATLALDSDGVTLDCAGNLYVAQQNVIVVYSPTGAELGRITPAGNAGATNAAFGGATGTTLYITALGQGIAQLSFVELGVPGLPY